MASQFWPHLLGGLDGEHVVIAENQLEALIDLIGAALVRRLLPGEGVDISDLEAQQSRLSNRFRRASGLRWTRFAEAGGTPVVCLKGMAAAHLYYDDADLRTMSDADLLVMAADRDRLVTHFRDGGLEFLPVEARSPWGPISDASMLPLTDPEGAANVDLHIHPDAWPLHLGLSTEDVFAAARTIDPGDGEGRPFRVPSATHMLLLSASHAARDLFGPSTVKSLIDVNLLLHQEGDKVDWDEFERRIRLGRVGKPVRAFLGILARLGANMRHVPEALRRGLGSGRWGGAEFMRALADYEALFPCDMSMLARARRELLLCAEPGVAMRRNGQRLLGMLRLG